MLSSSDGFTGFLASHRGFTFVEYEEEAEPEDECEHCKHFTGKACRFAGPQDRGWYCDEVRDIKALAE